MDAYVCMHVHVYILLQFEVYIHRGLVRVGFGGKTNVRVLGLEAFSFGFGSTGKKSWNG